MKTKHFRKALVLFQGKPAGILEEQSQGYRFTYDDVFSQNGIPISASLPLTKHCYESEELFSFFVGLLPEGWYLNLVCSTLKIDKNDVFGILLATCQDTAGAVSIQEIV